MAPWGRWWPGRVGGVASPGGSGTLVLPSDWLWQSLNSRPAGILPSGEGLLTGGRDKHTGAHHVYTYTPRGLADLVQMNHTHKRLVVWGPDYVCNNVCFGPHTVVLSLARMHIHTCTYVPVEQVPHCGMSDWSQKVQLLSIRERRQEFHAVSRAGTSLEYWANILGNTRDYWGGILTCSSREMREVLSTSPLVQRKETDISQSNPGWVESVLLHGCGSMSEVRVLRCEEDDGSSPNISPYLQNIRTHLPDQDTSCISLGYVPH